MHIDLLMDERRALCALATKAAEEEMVKATAARRVGGIPHLTPKDDYSERRAQWLLTIAKKLEY